jgi:hypothetical protein
VRSTRRRAVAAGAKTLRLCFASILTAVRITTQTCATRPERRRFGPSDDVDDLIAPRETQH